MTRRPFLPAVAALLLVVLAAGAVVKFGPGAPAQAERMRAGVYEPPRPAPEFSLPGTAGAEVSPALHRGKVVLLTFGFTRCAAVCPTTLSTLAQARRSLGKAADAVQVIFVTVDPERDTAAGMRDYLAAFDESFVGATGDAAALAKVRQDYGVSAEREGAGPDYAMVHTSSIFLIDPAGRLRAMMPYGRDPADFVNDIKILLR